MCLRIGCVVREWRQNNCQLSKDCDASVKLRHLKIFIPLVPQKGYFVYIYIGPSKLVIHSYIILVHISQSFGLNRALLTYPTKESLDLRITVMKGLFLIQVIMKMYTSRKTCSS